MSVSRWIIAVAFGLMCALAGQSLAQLAEQAEDNQTSSTRQYDHSEHQAAPFGIPVRILEEPEQAKVAKRQQQRATEREIQDLIAQQKMAYATDQLVRLTKLQVLLGVLGTVALVCTLYLNWRSTDAAVKTAQAERAWVIHHKFDCGTLDGLVNGTRTKNGFTVTAKWKNAGRSPSINTECYTEHKLIEPGKAIPIFQVDQMEGEIRQASIGPGNVFSGATRGLNDEEAAAVRNGSKTMVIYSKMTYRDIFADTPIRHSEICVVVKFNGEIEVDGDRSIPNVSFMPVGSQNSIS